jgi:hypothetical protein
LRTLARIQKRPKGNYYSVIKIQVMVFTFNAENLVGVCLQLIFEVNPGVGLVLYFSNTREKGRTIGQFIPKAKHSVGWDC